MISIKSEREIELMRKAGMMVSKTHKYLKPFPSKLVLNNCISFELGV